MRKLAIVSVSVLMAALLAAYLPVAAFLPSVAPIAFAGGERIPASTVTPLPEFVRTQVVDVQYEAEGTAGSSGVFWTELYYRLGGAGDWALYAPPWNPSGQWFGQLGFAGGLIRGTIPFDTYYTGGEATYEFYTVGVDRGYWREAMPRDHAKARTTLDTRPPNLFVGKPSPDAWTKDGTLTWTSTDSVSGLAAVEAALDDGGPMNFVVEVGAKQASGAEDLALTVEGDHHVLVRASDRAGNRAELFVPFHFDPNAPTLAITAPQAGRFLNTGDVEVVWTTGDSASGIASQRLRVDTATPVDLAADVASYMAFSLDERFHTVTIAVFDAAGNFATESVTFGVDVTAPSLALIAPEDASYTREHDMRVLWIGSDSVSGISRFEVSFAGVTSPPIESGVEFVFAGVDEGADTVRVVALDRAGNRAEVSADVTVDFTPPVVAITSPSAGAEVTGDLSIDFTATDAVSGIRTVQLVYDGTMMDVTGKTSQRILEPAAGAHIALIRATDRAGNTAERLVSFEYGAGGPIEPSNLPALEFWLLILLIGAIAVSSAYYAVRRRNRSKA
ncbi:MAG: Ig-like domain-containing protein [Methanobacteriota archaeon]